MNSREGLMDLKAIQCDQIAHRVDRRVRVQRASFWGCDLEIYRAPRVLHFPEYSFHVWDGFAPTEAINYPLHLGIAQARVPIGRTQFDPKDAQKSDAEVCILANPCTRTFGHWAEELLKVLILEESDFKGSYVLAPSPPPMWFESLSLLGVGRDRILVPETPTVFATGVFTTLVHHFIAHRFPGLFHALRDRLYAATPGHAGSGGRIWITRGAGARRDHGDVVNAGEVDGVIRHYGFEPVDFGQLTFAQQVAVDRDAKIFAGPHGSAFVHVGFMHDRAGVLEIFSPHYINPSVIQLCLAFGHRYRQMVPVHTPHEPYAHPGIKIDLEHLQLALDDLCEP